MDERFVVALSRDFMDDHGGIGWGDIGLDALEAVPGVEWRFLEGHTEEVTPEQLTGVDALLLLLPRVTAATLEGADRLKIVARFGVGYDNVDVAACTDNGVVVTITPDGVRRPMAVAALTLTLAITHRLVIKDRLTRYGGWDQKLSHMGMGLTGRTLATVGLGNIAREFLFLAAPLGMRHVAADPYVEPDLAADLGVELLELEDLMEQADVVVVTSALTPETHHLIDGPLLQRMKPTAHLVNIARGPVVDQAALTEVLRSEGIAGAALDVFESEPISPDDPLTGLDNTILTPHAVGWTDEVAMGNGSSACRAIIDVAEGRMPEYPVNPEAADGPRARRRLTPREVAA